MLGAEGTVDLVQSYLAANMPAKIAALQTRLGVTSTDLRAPALYSTSLYERIEIAQFPAIEVQFQAFGQPVFLDNNAGQLTYRWPYRLRVYIEERGNSYDQVEQRRKRLLLGVTELLTSHPMLSASSPTAWVDVTSMTASFFGLGTLAQAKDARSIAACYLELVVMVEEMTDALTPIGTADTIVVSVYPANQ